MSNHQGLTVSTLKQTVSSPSSPFPVVKKGNISPAPSLMSLCSIMDAPVNVKLRYKDTARVIWSECQLDKAAASVHNKGFVGGGAAAAATAGMKNSSVNSSKDNRKLSVGQLQQYNITTTPPSMICELKRSQTFEEENDDERSKVDVGSRDHYGGHSYYGHQSVLRRTPLFGRKFEDDRVNRILLQRCSEFTINDGPSGTGEITHF